MPLPLKAILADNMSTHDRSLSDLDIQGRPELVSGQIQEVSGQIQEVISERDDLAEEEC